MCNIAQLHEMNSLCLCRAVELSTGQTSAHPDLPDGAGSTQGTPAGRGWAVCSSTAQGGERRNQTESVPALLRCGSLLKAMKGAPLPACFPLEKANGRGSQLALAPSLWLGWALSEGRFVQALPPCPPTQGEAPLLEGKRLLWEDSQEVCTTQYGVTDETWKSRSKWYSVIPSDF